MSGYAFLVIDQGSDYSSEMTVDNIKGLPYDLTGYTVQGQIRKSYQSLTHYDFDIVVLDPLTGTVAINLDKTVSLSMKPGRYVYDINIMNSAGKVTRVVEGLVEITPGVTR
jgi:hypothetical protein